MGRPERMKLLRLFDNTWNTRKLLTEWKKATVIPILKLGKDPNETESYQPISQTILCKILERMVNKRSTYILEDRGLLPDTQYGFWKAKSTTNVLIGIEGFIAEAIWKKEYAALLSLDISKAITHAEDLRLSSGNWKTGGKILTAKY
jgi:hypothetical protein